MNAASDGPERTEAATYIYVKSPFERNDYGKKAGERILIGQKEGAWVSQEQRNTPWVPS